MDEVFPHHTPPSDNQQDTAGDSIEEDLLDTSLVISPLALDSVTDAPEHNITANAAQLSTDALDHKITANTAQLLIAADQEEILHLNVSFDMYATPTVISIPINRLPTLGLILSETPMTNQVL